MGKGLVELLPSNIPSWNVPILIQTFTKWQFHLIVFVWSVKKVLWLTWNGKEKNYFILNECDFMKGNWNKSISLGMFWKATFPRKRFFSEFLCEYCYSIFRNDGYLCLHNHIPSSRWYMDLFFLNITLFQSESLCRTFYCKNHCADMFGIFGIFWAKL